MKIKKTIIVTLFLLCLLMLGTASAKEDNGTIASSDVTNDTVCINDDADNSKLYQSDDDMDNEKTRPTSSSQETFINKNDNSLESSEDNAKLNDDNPMTFDKLRDEIENAPIGETIILSKDNYTYENTAPIKVKENLTIDGNYSWFDGRSANMSGLFCVEGDNVVLKNIFFINWELEDSYNIIEWFGENGTLSNCVFLNNVVIKGCMDWSGPYGVIDECYFGYDYGMDNSGALCIYSDGVTVKNSFFINNEAINDGGAIYSLGKDTAITNCTFTNCSSLRGKGGAVYIYSDYNLITNCTIINCTALDCGGAIYVSGDNNIINDSNYANNKAFNDGGAIFLVGGECCVNNSYFESNSADGDGGAIYSKGTNDFNVDNCTFVNNSAEVYGGALIIENNAIVNSSIFKNNSALAAGAIFSKDMLIISDSLFNENTAEVGGAIVLNDDSEIISSNITNNIGFNGGAIAVLNDLTLEINSTQFKNNLANLSSNNIVLITNATVTADNKTTFDSPLILKSVTLSPLYEENITYGDTLHIIVYVDFGNIPMENGTVLTELDGKTYMSPVKDGFAFFNITDLNPGNYSSYLTYTQEGYVNATVEYNFTVEKKDPADLKIAKITAKTTSFVINYAKSYKITLKDGDGKVISGKKVKFKLNGKTIGTRTTSSKGIATIKITSKMLRTAKAGTKKLTITFADSNYKSASKVVKVKMNQEKTKFVANKKTFKVKTKTKKYTVTLKNSKSKGIKNAKLTLKVKGKIYKAKTNKKGKATFKITKLNKKGKYTALIKFKTTKYYKATSKKVKITVKK